MKHSYFVSGRLSAIKRHSIIYLFLSFAAFWLLTGCHQHQWSPADCVTPETCAQCGETNGEALEHDWVEADCTQPQTCTRCGETTGNTLEHSAGAWDEAIAATCTHEGKEESACTVCGTPLQRITEPLGHDPDGEWVITEEAIGPDEGIRVQSCTRCNEVALEEPYSLPPEEQAASFKAACQSYTYNEIARNPSNYMLERAVFRGEVIQVMEDGNSFTLRVNVTPERYFWSDTLYVEYTQDDPSEGRILEDDIITMYGYLMDTVTYETIFGASVTIPAMLAVYIEFG